MSAVLRKRLMAAVDEIQPDLLIAENALTIPMNVPFGVALLQVIQQTGIECVAHHHDFVWERERYLVNCIDDFLAAAFPPPLHQIRHVVINRIAAEQFSRRIGLPVRVIPNVMDFEHPPADPDDYALSFRDEIGLAPDDLLILQPTRVVARKAIEKSIELIRRLNNPRAKLIISHDIGDEGRDYADYLREFAEMMNVEIIFAAERIADQRGTTAEGLKQFTIHDIYPQADLVTYPSTTEGFGNAFLEAIYYRRPLVCNRYTIYRTDIEPSGVSPIVFDGFLTDATIDQVHSVLDDPQYARDMVEYNYQAARQYFSYEILEERLREILHWIGTCPRRACDCE
jgi:glycosyltransferase involved in cell wall biosynthesis